MAPPSEMIRAVPLQERVLTRIQQLVAERDFSHEALAPHLGISASAVSKLLNGKNAIGLSHLEGFCRAFQMTPSEIVAEYGSLIQSVTPVEAAVLHLVRQMTELERRSLLTLLERPIYTAAPHAKKSRLGRAMLTVKEQELVDLFARVKRDGVREGVLRTLRGAAQDDPYAAPDKPRTTG